MPFLIGTDEAGYGPNLGPLTITGTLWRSQFSENDLYAALAEVVCERKKGRNDPRLIVADSKQVYKPSGSIRELERSVLSLVRATDKSIPQNVKELCQAVCPTVDWESIRTQQGYLFDDVRLPLAASLDSIEKSAERFCDCAAQADVELLKIDCSPVFPNTFNRRVQQLGNKAHLLSGETLKIARRLKVMADDDLEIICDKHGGRNRYAGVIQHVLTDQAVSVGAETRAESDYAFREDDRDVIVRFRAGGESFLPTAVASMVSKYVREVFMIAWNQFWTTRVDDLKPTKGYPVDAKRFKMEIANKQTELSIKDADIWRCR
ncbi:MAG: hypothetical protein AAFN77_18610 [Planctomycetota bacterium]